MAVVFGIIASVIVLGFILFEITEIVRHAGDTTTSSLSRVRSCTSCFSG
jgi:hypothetical protein